MDKSEYKEYHQQYMDLVKGQNALDELEKSYTVWEDFMMDLDDSEGDHAYEEGKWTVKEVLQHIVDCERVFQYRALAIARGDKTELPGFNHNDYVVDSRCQFKTLEQIDTEFVATRNASLALFKSFDGDQLERIGNCGYPMSVRALGNLMGGHLRHHINVLEAKYV